MKYSFIKESVGFESKLFPNGMPSFLNFCAIGGMLGSTLGGASGLAYAYYMYKDKNKTITNMDQKISDPNLSPYSRKLLIDERNMISGMSDFEYKRYCMKEYYSKGSKAGAMAGTTIGAILSLRKRHD